MTPNASPSPAGGGFLPPGPLDYSATGVLWLDYLIDIFIVVAAIGIAAYSFYAVRVKPLLEKIARDSRQAAGMTANSHGNTSNPNLRDDMDAKHQEILSQNQQILANQEIQGRLIEEVARAQVRQDKELARIHEAQAADREDTRRVREALDEHISDKRDFAPRLAEVERELKTHRKKTETS